MSHPHSEFPGPTPQIAVSDAARAVHFYRDAFGADELVRNLAPDGRIMHCELLVLGGRLIVIDDFDTDPISAPTRLGGTTIRLHLYVSDVDEIYAHALAAGATGIAEPADSFWGDRYAMLRDPFGHLWSLATVREDLTLAELEHRADTWSGHHDQPG